MPDAEGRHATPAFERAAIEELERLQRDLEASRRRRQAAADAFDAMLRQFDDAAAPRTDGPERSRSAREASEGPRAGRAPLVPATESPRPGRPTAPAGRWPPLLGLGLVAAVAIVLMAAVVLLPRGGVRVQDAGAMPVAPASVDAPVAEPLPEPAPPPPPAELVTTRQVWVRVTVDGERVIERELSAGTRVPLEARGTVLVRAGDGGAVRLLVRGEDQGVLGTDGAVVTRTFTVE
jgi:hypothetical protein